MSSSAPVQRYADAQYLVGGKKFDPKPYLTSTCVNPLLLQRYVDAPYLVGGKKFDLRIYALVTNFSPLRIFLYRWECILRSCVT